MGTASTSWKDLSKNPYWGQIRKIIKNLVILSKRNKQKNFIFEILEITEKAVNVPLSHEIPKNGKTEILRKGQYVAIVGQLPLSEQQCLIEAKTIGFASESIKMFKDYHEFKSGTYNDKLTSPSCVAVIFGGIPHSHKDNIKSLLGEKSYFAKINSGRHGKLKITKKNLAELLEQIRNKIVGDPF